jgi:hypothetical protein
MSWFARCGAGATSQSRLKLGSKLLVVETEFLLGIFAS